MKSKYMQTSSARPYAKAAFEFALTEQTLTVWSEGLNQAALIVSVPEMESILENPQVTKEKGLEFLLSIKSDTWQPTLQNFLCLLAEKGRLLLLPVIAHLFDELCAEYHKTTEVQVHSAFPLTAEQQQRLQNKLQQRLQTKTHLNFSIDKSLLGGYLIRAGDLVIDASLRGRITRLNYALRDQQL